MGWLQSRLLIAKVLRFTDTIFTVSPGADLGGGCRGCAMMCDEGNNCSYNDIIIHVHVIMKTEMFHIVENIVFN